MVLNDPNTMAFRTEGMNNKETTETTMQMNKDILEWMKLLDNRHSYIHQPAFKQLKRSFIRQITVAYETSATTANTTNG